MALTVRTGEALAPHTTFRVGGAASFYVEATSTAELAEAVAYARTHRLPLTVLGGGSNVLVADAGVAGLVVHLATKGVAVEHDGTQVYLTAAAGEALDAVVARCVEAGYWGLENLSHIPGSVGATPVQNVGAYGMEVAERIAHVEVFDTATATTLTLSPEQCQFGYRDSVFKHEAGQRYIVTAVTFLLTTTPRPVLDYRDLHERFAGTTPTLAAIRDAVIEIRSKKFPDWHVVGTAGSFFKNPIISREHYAQLQTTYPTLPCYDVDSARVKVPLGWVLDKVLQVRGTGTETVGCYEGQALVVVNRGGATASDIVAFAQSITDRVHAELGIDVEWEVTKLA